MKTVKHVMHVIVTAEDIVFGKRGSAVDCPVARALGPRSSVGCLMLATPEGTFLAPLEVRDFIARFDRGEQVLPFEFDLEMPNV